MQWTLEWNGSWKLSFKGTSFSKISLTFHLLKRPFLIPVTMGKHIRMPQLKNRKARHLP